MKQTRPRSGEWVIVCDGRKALILENVGDDKFINLRTKEVHEHADPPTHRLGTDASERVFLEKLVQRFDIALTGGETKAFIVIAAPRALGMLRSAYTPAVRRAIKAEIGRDYVKMPVHEIEKTFMD